ncbi:MAG TPA: CDP-alcohol phosphatidyltransferase family protein [Micropepsaceae bacterium]|nr:CDP-alcohol phosphatidyltransferase family protein [Micropepsaceae bacterium]
MMLILRHLPNLITTLRLAAAPMTAALLAAGHFNAAFGLFAFAGLSDAVDGFLAKRFNLRTRLGQLLDPAADKALMLTAFVTLAILDDVPAWLTVTVIARDSLILLGLASAVALRAPIAVQPLVLGKVCTALQVLYIGWHLAALAFDLPTDATAPADAYIVAIFAWMSGFAYLAVWFKAMRAIPAQEGRRA